MRNNYGFSLVGLSLAASLFVGCSLDDQYFDARQVDAYQLDTDLPVEEVSFSSNGETIFGVFVPAATVDANTLTVLYFHGDDKDIDKFIPRLEELYPVNGDNVNLFIFDFQGYGRSTGSPSLDAIYQNSADALTYLQGRAEVDSDRIVYYAFSLGGIFAAQLADTVAEPYAFIGEAMPASSNRVIRSSTGLGIPGSFFFDETFNTAASLQGVDAPALLLHGDADNTVPFDDHAPLLFDIVEAQNTLSQTQRVVGAGHSTVISTLGSATYVEVIDDFLNGL